MFQLHSMSEWIDIVVAKIRCYAFPHLRQETLEHFKQPLITIDLRRPGLYLIVYNEIKPFIVEYNSDLRNLMLPLTLEVHPRRNKLWLTKYWRCCKKRQGQVRKPVTSLREWIHSSFLVRSKPFSYGFHSPLLHTSSIHHIAAHERAGPSLPHCNMPFLLPQITICHKLCNDCTLSDTHRWSFHGRDSVHPPSIE